MMAGGMQEVAHVGAMRVNAFGLHTCGRRNLPVEVRHGEVPGTWYSSELPQVSLSRVDRCGHFRAASTLLDEQVMQCMIFALNTYMTDPTKISISVNGDITDSCKMFFGCAR